MSRFFDPGAMMESLAPGHKARPYASIMGTQASRRILGADGKTGVILQTKYTGSYSGRAGNYVKCLVYRVTSAPRYLLQFFEADGTQIGGNIVVNGSNLTTLASTLASDDNGSHFVMTVVNDTNQAYDAGSGESNASFLQGGTGMS